MILPIVAYGDPVLRKVAKDINRDYPGLAALIENMYETMYKAGGVGLAAPQVGLAIRLFVVDSSPLFEEDEQDQGIKQVFINAELEDELGDPWGFSEGCLSIPKIREEVFRKEEIRIRFLDASFQERSLDLDDLNARVVQHEYDHIQGKLFTDYLKPLKKKLLRSRLDAISKGQVQVDYKMRFPKK